MKIWNSLLSSHQESMFPIPIWAFINCIFFYMHCISLIYCIRNRLYFPSTISSKPFKSYLSTKITLWILKFHMLWYVMEIVYTRLVFDFFNMFMHHVFAIGVFMLAHASTHLICFISIASAALHSLYWHLFLWESLMDQDSQLMFLVPYNIVFCIGGFFTYYDGVIKGQAISKCMAICVWGTILSNYTVYCQEFYGYYCLPYQGHWNVWLNSLGLWIPPLFIVCIGLEFLHFTPKVKD